MKQRAPERIRPLLDQIEQVWRERPELRLCQLLASLANEAGWPSADLFFLEDEALKSVLPQAPDLLAAVRARLGGALVTIYVSRERLVAEWRRLYSCCGVESDLRYAEAATIEDLLRAILAYEDEADAEEGGCPNGGSHG